MNSIDTTEFQTLAPPRPLLDALICWDGFVELGEATEAKAGPSWFELANEPGASWRWSGGLPAVPLAPIGCMFVKNIEVQGCGHLISKGSYVRDHAHCSDVAFEWFRVEKDNNSSRKARKLIIEDPVIVVTSAGHTIYGHWILDFLPRIVITSKLLGSAFSQMKILLPSDTPAWVPRMLDAYCGIHQSRIIYYSESSEIAVCYKACIPSFAHNGSYSFHPIVRQFYQEIGGLYGKNFKQRILISRGSFSSGRTLENRLEFENLALARGYKIFRPESLDFREQVSMFRSAECILGECGSGLHGSVFSKPGTVVGSIDFNWIQCHVSAAFEQPLISMNRVTEVERTPDGTRRFSALRGDIISLLDYVDTMVTPNIGSPISHK